MAKRVLIAEASGGRVRGRPRLGWMDGVKNDLGQQRNEGRGCATIKIGKSGEPWCICNWMSFMPPGLLGTVFFRTALPCSGSYHLERDEKPLHTMWLG